MTEQIFVSKHDEIYLKVTADPGVEAELSDYFRYQVDGYKFSPKYRSGMWDGFLRMFNLGRKTLYVGLFSKLQEFASNNDYEIVASDELAKTNNLDREEIYEWARNLNIALDGESITPYDHQLKAIYEALNSDRLTLESPTSSGKSLIIYCCIRWHLEHDRRTLLIVPTTQLCEQMYSDFKEYSTLNEWPVDDHCQMLYSGKSKEITKDVLISTWQSLHADKKTKDKKKKLEYAFDVTDFDSVIVDEVHLAAAMALTDLLESMTHIKYRLGVTGTLSDSKANRLQVCGLFGREFKVITTRELMDLGIVVELDIRCLVIGHCDEDRLLVKKAEYSAELDFVTQLKKRNEFIANLAIATTGNTLVLVSWIDKHLIKLEELIKDKAVGRNVYVIHGDVKPAEREAIRIKLQREENAITIASSATCSTGVNIPSIENIILGLAGKSKIRNLQSIGRGLRLKAGKTGCKLFDIADNLCIKKQENHLFRHFKNRVAIYDREQFNYKIIEVKL